MKPKTSRKRSLWVKLSAFTLITLFTLLLGEALVRAFVYLKSKSYPTQTTKLDKDLGWVPKPSFTFEGLVPDATNQEYQLNYYTDEKGFKAFGDKSTTNARPKVFYLGDSFTQAIEVSNDKTYYGLLEQQLRLNTFAYGCRGFSNLQEYMILDDYYDSVQPDMVVLQFCYNDFINNQLELEQNSIFNNNRRLRPYLIDNSIEKRYAARLPLRWLNDHSMVFQLVLTSIEKIWNSRVHDKKETTEAKIASLGQEYPPFQRSISTTRQLLQKLKDRLAPDTPLILFYVGEYQDNYHLALQSICEDLDIPLINSISRRLEEHQKEKKNIFAKDRAHWNELGHQIAAEELSVVLRSYLPEQKLTDQIQ